MPPTQTPVGQPSLPGQRKGSSQEQHGAVPTAHAYPLLGLVVKDPIPGELGTRAESSKCKRTTELADLTAGRVGAPRARQPRLHWAPSARREVRRWRRQAGVHTRVGWATPGTALLGREVRTDAGWRPARARWEHLAPGRQREAVGALRHSSGPTSQPRAGLHRPGPWSSSLTGERARNANSGVQWPCSGRGSGRCRRSPAGEARPSDEAPSLHKPAALTSRRLGTSRRPTASSHLREPPA